MPQAARVKENLAAGFTYQLTDGPKSLNSLKTSCKCVVAAECSPHWMVDGKQIGDEYICFISASGGRGGGKAKSQMKYVQHKTGSGELVHSFDIDFLRNKQTKKSPRKTCGLITQQVDQHVEPVYISPLLVMTQVTSLRVSSCIPFTPVAEFFFFFFFKCHPLFAPAEMIYICILYLLQKRKGKGIQCWIGDD